MERLFGWRPVWPGPEKSGGLVRQSRATTDPTVLAWRGANIVGGVKWPPHGSQVVVREVSTAKSRAAILRTVRYVGRLSDRETSPERRPGLQDEIGRPVSGAGISDTLDTWGLLPSGENLSKKARDADREGRDADLAEMGERARLHHVQGRHLVLSIPANPDDEGEAERFQSAVEATVSRLFGMKGYRAIWAIHRDKPNRLHAHVVVNTVSRLGERLRVEKSGEFFDRARIEFVTALRAVGFDVDTSRREDRWKLREQVMAGLAPLRNHQSMQEIHRGSGRLDVRAPLWWSRYGQAYRERQRKKERKNVLVDPIEIFNRRGRKPTGKPPESNWPDEYQELVNLFPSLYQEPEGALESWLRLAVENNHHGPDGQEIHPNLSLAKWYLRKRPEVFGDLSLAFDRHLSKKEVEAAVSTVELPVLEELQASRAAPRQAHRQRKLGDVMKDRARVCSSLMRIAEETGTLFGNESRARRIRERVVEGLEIPIADLPSQKQERRSLGRAVLNRIWQRAREKGRKEVKPRMPEKAVPSTGRKRETVPRPRRHRPRGQQLERLFARSGFWLFVPHFFLCSENLANQLF